MINDPGKHRVKTTGRPVSLRAGEWRTHVFTSPRARGEVARLSPQGEGGRVRGRIHALELFDRPPHPDPLPARGERERAVLGEMQT
jgi:hypothetical protein